MIDVFRNARYEAKHGNRWYITSIAIIFARNRLNILWVIMRCYHKILVPNTRVYVRFWCRLMPFASVKNRRCKDYNSTTVTSDVIMHIPFLIWRHLNRVGSVTSYEDILILLDDFSPRNLFKYATDVQIVSSVRFMSEAWYVYESSVIMLDS